MAKKETEASFRNYRGRENNNNREIPILAFLGVFSVLYLMLGGPLLLGGWLFFLIPAGLSSAACWVAGRNRVAWYFWEHSVIFVPFLLWAFFLLYWGKGRGAWKSMSNVGAEPLIVGCCVAIMFIARTSLGNFKGAWALAVFLYLLCCLCAICVYFFVPPLPE
jgi:hypothetical protein